MAYKNQSKNRKVTEEKRKARNHEKVEAAKVKFVDDLIAEAKKHGIPLPKTREQMIAAARNTEARKYSNRK